MVTCMLLAVNPMDEFLQPWREACMTNPALPSVSDFMQMATACLPGMLCKSFNVEDVEFLPDGEYGFV